MTLQDFFIEVANYSATFFSMVEVFCKMLFQDLVFFNLPLGWWFIIFAFIGFIIANIFGGGK